jgi:membrane-associated protease RseP (regulator of RpoE activity)
MFLFKRVHTLLAAIVCAALTLVWTAAYPADEKAKEQGPENNPEKSQADLEARLEDARARLEAAAREVAELSGQLTGPIMQDFMIAGAPGMHRAMLGINLGDQASRDGVRVQSVTPGAPASDAGLRAGDVIVSVDGVNLRSKDKPSSATLVEHMRDVKVGDKVKVEYLRDGKSHMAEITTEAFGARGFVMAGPGPDRFFSMRVPGPMEAVPALPAVPPVPFTMAFPATNVLDMELVAMTPKLGKYFGTEKGVLVVRAPRDSQLKLEDGDVILDIDGRVPQNGAHALRILSSYQPGEKLNINVLRDRKQTKLALTVPERGPMTAPGPGGAGAMWYGTESAAPVVKPFKGVIVAPESESDGPT